MVWMEIVHMADLRHAVKHPSWNEYTNLCYQKKKKKENPTIHTVHMEKKNQSSLI